LCPGEKIFEHSLGHYKQALSRISGYAVIQCESSPFTPETKPSHDEEFFETIRKGDLKRIQSFVKNNISSLKETDEESWTCLHWAVEMGHTNMVTLLLDSEPLLLNMKTREGLSPINIAAWRGDKRMVELLINQGAEIDDKTKWGETPLHHAVTFGHSDVCELLLSHGADPNTEDRLKRTPAQIATQKGTKNVQKILEKYTKKD